MKKHSFSIIVIFVYVVFNSIALAQKTADTLFLRNCLERGNSFLNQNLDSSLYWYNQGLAIATKLSKNDKGVNFYTSLLLLKRAAAQFNQGVDATQTIADFEKAKEGLEADAKNSKSPYANAATENLATCYYFLGNTNFQAEKDSLSFFYYRKAVDLFRKLQKADFEAYCYLDMANFYRFIQQYDVALKYYISAESLFTEQGNTEGLLSCYYGKALLFKLTDKSEKAVAELDRMKKLCNQNNDVAGLIKAFKLQAEIETMNKNYDKVLRIYTTLLDIYRDFDESLEQFNMISYIGDTYLKMGDTAKAVANYTEAAELAAKKDLPKNAADNYYYIGLIYEDLKKTTDAIRNFEMAEKYALAAGDSNTYKKTVSKLAFHLYGVDIKKAVRYYHELNRMYVRDADFKRANACDVILGLYYQENKEFEKALQHLFKVLDYYEKNNDYKGIAETVNSIGNCYLLSNQPKKAKPWYKRSLKYAEDSGNAEAIYIAQINLGKICFDAGEYKEAAEVYEKAYYKAAQAGDTSNLAVFVDIMADAFFYLKQNEKALLYYKRALPIAKSKRDLGSEAYLLRQIGNIFHNKGKLDSAKQYYRKAIELYALSNNKSGLANTQVLLASVLNDLNDFKNAESTADAALEMFKNSDDSKGTINALGAKANIYSKKGDYATALMLFEQALEKAKKNGDPVLLSDCYNNLGMIQYNMGLYAKAKENFLISKKIIETDNNTGSLSVVLSNLALVENEYGNYKEAEKLYTKAYKLSMASEDNIGAGIALNNLGLNYYKLGKKDSTFSCFAKAEILFEQTGYKNGIISILNNRGLILSEDGKYYEASKYYEKSIALSMETEFSKGVLNGLINSGVVYNGQGNFKKALQTYEKALQLSNKMNDFRGEADCYTNIGVVFIKRQEYQKGITYFEKAYELYKTLNNKKNYSFCINNIGAAYYEMKDFANALKYLQQAYDMRKKNNEKLQLSLTCGSIAKTYLELKNYDLALAAIEEALQISKSAGAQKLTYDNLLTRADILIAMNRTQEAYGFYLDANRYFKSELLSNFGYLSEKEKELFLEESEKSFGKIVAVADLTRADTLIDAVFNNQLLFKGLLLNSTQRIFERLRNSKDSIVKRKFSELMEIKLRLNKMEMLADETQKPTMDSLEERATLLERELIEKSGELSALSKSYNTDWKEVRNALTDNEAAIEFIRFYPRLNQGKAFVNEDSIVYAALLVRKNSRHPEWVRLCYEKDLKKLLDKSGKDDYDYITELYGKEKGIKLYGLIWKPLQAKLSGITTVYLSPAGLLHKLSFAAVPSENTGKLLSDEYQLVNVSNTSEVVRRKESGKLDSDDFILLYGGINYNADTAYIAAVNEYYRNNKTITEKIRAIASEKQEEAWSYLPGTLDETKAIKELFEKNSRRTRWITYSRAMEETVKSVAGDDSPPIIHIATHGFSFPEIQTEKDLQYFEKSFVQSNNPLFRSGILFAAANRTWNGKPPAEGIEDGIITAYEVSNLNLSNTKIVVLSACETGLGEIKGSEGVYGLPRALRMAGVKNVLTTLWTIPDEQTVELMRLFYDGLFQGKSFRQALMQAQNVMKQKYPPYYWAAFVLTE